MGEFGNVVGIHGYEPPRALGESVPCVVEHFENMLEAARAGQIVAVASAYVIHDGTPDKLTEFDWKLSGINAWALYWAMKNMVRDFERKMLTDERLTDKPERN